MKINYADTPALLGEPHAYLEGDTFDVGNGEVGIALPQGGVLSVQPGGSYGSRPTVGGSYERFRPDPKLNVLWVTPRVATYAIPYREA